MKDLLFKMVKNNWNFIYLFFLILWLASACVNSEAEFKKSDSTESSNQHFDKRYWQSLINEDKYEEARKICTKWLSHPENSYKTEAHKCLANVELSGSSKIVVEGGDIAGGSIREGFEGKGVDLALGHLEKALNLSPSDLSVHQGRLHILMMAGRYHETPKALEDSIKKYKGKNALDAWLAYSSRFHEVRQYRSGLKFLRVLERYYPSDHRVIANIGAFLGILKKYDEALKYAEKAVKLNPNDPINNWNLGRIYDYTNKLEMADKYYNEAIRLAKGNDKGFPYHCIYADFVEKRLKDKLRACEIRESSCQHEFSSKCK